MEEIQNYNQVVVNLDSEGGISVNTPTTTFEEAFMGEEFSEAQGKRRAKKQSRKIQKTTDKRARKTAKRGKKSDRQEERLGRRATRKSLKQDIRDEQAERRQTRRSRRPSAVDQIVSAREKMRPEEEYVEETFQEGFRDEEYDNKYYPSDEQEEQEYNDSEELDQDYQDDQDDQDESEYEEDEADYGDESESEGMDEEMIYDEENNFTGEMSGKKPVPKEIMDCCMKIEWNDELIARLKDAKQKNSLSDVSTMRIQDIIDEKQSRMNELKSSLDDYAKQSPENAAIAKEARMKARKERMKICPYPIRKRLRERGMSDQQINEWWTKTGQQKIEQKMSNAAGMPSVSTREESTRIADFEEPVLDYDQPKTQVVDIDENGEVKSNMTGENKDFWKSVLIGSLVGFAAIYAINKYKLLK